MLRIGYERHQHDRLWHLRRHTTFREDGSNGYQHPRKEVSPSRAHHSRRSREAGHSHPEDSSQRKAKDINIRLFCPSRKYTAATVAVFVFTGMVMPFIGHPRTELRQPGSYVWTKNEVKRYAKAVWHTTPAKWKCLDQLNLVESKWDYQARGARTRLGHALGIAQALPADKMASVGIDYKSNPITQILWQKKYIEKRYNGNPCWAWKHEQRRNWY